MSESGSLQIGTNDQGEVVINLDKDRTGHINFSPSQARSLAVALVRKAKEAEGESDPGATPPDFDSITTDELIAELVKRHRAIVIGRYPHSGDEANFRSFGDYFACRGLADVLLEHVRAGLMRTEPHQEGT